MIKVIFDPHRETGYDVTALAKGLAVLESECFSDPWSENAFREALTNPVIVLAVLEKDGVLIGYALYSVIAPEAELLNLGVSSAFRKQGNAGLLMDETFLYLRKRSVSEVFLEVRESNTAARGLYLKKGFVPIGKRRAYYRYPTEDAIVMMAHFDE